MIAIFKNRSALLTWLIIATLAGIYACLLPLTETLGYEFSLIIALITSLGAGHLASLRPSRVRNKLAPFPGVRFPVIKLFWSCLPETSALLLPPLGLVLLNGLRVPPCNLAEGLLFYALLPVPAVLFATAAGLFGGLLSLGRKSASILWFIMYAMLIAKGFHSFHSTPAVFSFGPLHGYFPGVLYDTLISIDHRLLSYRVATLLHGSLFLSLAAIFYDPATLRLSIKRLTFNLRSFAWPTVLILGIIAFHLAEPSLGQRITRSALEEKLPQKITRGQLDVFFSAHVSPEKASLLADDAAFSLYQVKRFFAVNNTNDRIAVFIFNNSSHKGTLIGASQTNVAKPWRSEVYVVLDDVPHKVLRHELAHVVAGWFGQGPFAIAGVLNGLWPNPGLIEGLASAAQGPRGDLSLHQWAAAMKKLKLLPSISRLFGMGFLNTSASAAYTAAGSFCIWIHDNYGPEALKDLYGGASWKQATGVSSESLELQWQKFLSTVLLSEADISAAEQRFDRPSVIGTTCVHEVSRLNRQARRFLKRGRPDESIKIREAALKRSGGSTGSKLALLNSFVSLGRKKEASFLAGALLRGNELGARRKTTVREIMADMSFDNGDILRAKGIYGDLISLVSNFAAKRRLIVKEHLAHLNSPSASFIVKALALRPTANAPSTPLLMLHVATTAMDNPNDPIASYLLARQFLLYGDDKSGLIELENADRTGLSQTAPPIRIAAEMLKGQALFRQGHLNKAHKVFNDLISNPSSNQGTIASARDWLDRCSFTIPSPD